MRVIVQGYFEDLLDEVRYQLYPSSFYEAKEKFRDLGLGYDLIHACKYDCILYWKEFSNSQQCPVCHGPRYKINGGKSKIPHKVLCHFLLISK